MSTQEEDGWQDKRESGSEFVSPYICSTYVAALCFFDMPLDAMNFGSDFQLGVAI